MEMKGFMGGLYRITEWIYRFAISNILWVLCSVPFLFLCLMAMNAVNLEDLGPFYLSLVLLGIVAPFTLFPASGALLSVVRKWVMGEEDAPVFKTYFRGYKNNFKQSVGGGILFVILLFLFIINYYFYANMDNAFQVISIFFLLLIVVWAAAVFYYMCIMVHVHMKMFSIIKNAFVLSIGRPLFTLAILVLNGLIIYFSLFVYSVFIMFFSGSLIAYGTFTVFFHLFGKIEEQQEALESEQNSKEETEAEN